MTATIRNAKSITIQHVTIRSSQPFESVKAKLERLVPRLDDGIFTLLRYGEAKRALLELEAMPPIMIFGVRDHGAVLSTIGQTRKALQYDIGNPLTASKMTRHDLSAALYAPIRVLVLENDDGGTAIEYDRPISTFGQFENEEINIVARELDMTLSTALEAAAERDN